MIDGGDEGERDRLWLEDEDDDSGGEEGGDTSVLKPSNRGSPRGKTASGSDEDEDESVFDSLDTPNIPQIDELNYVEELENGYKLSFFRGKWYLYDENGEFVEAFEIREKAIGKTYNRKPPRGHGM